MLSVLLGKPKSEAIKELINNNIEWRILREDNDIAFLLERTNMERVSLVIRNGVVTEAHRG